MLLLELQRRQAAQARPRVTSTATGTARNAATRSARRSCTRTNREPKVPQLLWKGGVEQAPDPTFDHVLQHLTRKMALPDAARATTRSPFRNLNARQGWHRRASCVSRATHCRRAMDVERSRAVHLD